MKTVCFLILLFFVPCLTTNGQQYLNVPLVGQENFKWCWAASIQMIHQFHGTNPISQCQLVHEFRKFEKRKTASPPITLANICCGYDCNLLPVTSLCNNWLPFSKRDGRINHHYFDLINSTLGYNSMEDLETQVFDGPKIEHEINSCRPFAIFLSKLDPTQSPYNHVVVAKGYHKFGNQGYILVNDPQNTTAETGCFGCEFLIPYEALIEPTSSLNSSLQVVRSIFPKNSVECTPCTKLNPTNSNSFIAAVSQNINNGLLFNVDQTQFLSTNFTTLSSASFAGSLLYNQHTFSITDGTNKIKTFTVLVALQATPQIAVIFEKSTNGDYKVKEIINNQCTLFRSKILLTLSKNGINKNYSLDNTQYQVVEIVQENQFFYQTTIENVEYLSPVKTYPGLPFRANFLYKKELVLKQITKEDSKPQIDNDELLKKKSKRPK